MQVFSALPLLVGLLLAAASLTPSLIPRDWIIQGGIAGASMASGYLATQFFMAIWRTLEIPMLPERWRNLAHAIIAVPVLGLLILCVSLSDDWQNDIRARMTMPPVEAMNTTKMILLALAVFVVLFLLGLAFQVLFDMLRGRLARYIPVRSANVLGLVLAVLVAVFLTRDGVVNNLFRLLDGSQVAAQHLMNPNHPPPTGDWQSGSENSLADWDLMGAPGRDHVLGGPDAAAISAFSGRPAKEPLRIYVGRVPAGLRHQHDPAASDARREARAGWVVGHAAPPGLQRHGRSRLTNARTDSRSARSGIVPFDGMA